MVYTKRISKYESLCNTSNHINNLYINNNIVYKIYNKPSPTIESPLPILINRDIKHAINIKDILFNKKKDLIYGCTTIYDNDWKSLSYMINNYIFDTSYKKEMFNVFFEFISELINKYNIFYTDIHLRNIGISDNKIKFLDIDEAKIPEDCRYNDDYRLITYDNLVVAIVQIILSEKEITNKLYGLVDYLFPVTDIKTEINNLIYFINNYSSNIDKELKNYYYKK